MQADFTQDDLFASSAVLPHGLVYRRDVLTRAEEATLLETFRALPFREARFREYTARRRVVRFHAPETAGIAESGIEEDVPSLVLPAFMTDLRVRVAIWSSQWIAAFGPEHPKRLEPEAFVHALVSEYRPGTPIGWHRDKSDYGLVVGLSLGSRATMRFRPVADVRRRVTRNLVALDLEPRSAYVMQGPIRWDWQHSILPTRGLRYSITFRTRSVDPALARDLSPPRG
jgi:alkylated DNA repair dioxygenase AlkB